jgi:hypothetical protein
VFLYGPSNNGKSSFINFIFRDYINSGSIFVPTPQKNHFENWERQIQPIIMFDEFKFDDFPQELILPLLECSPKVSVNVRYKQGNSTYDFRGVPTIIIAQHSIKT